MSNCISIQKPAENIKSNGSVYTFNPGGWDWEKQEFNPEQQRKDEMALRVYMKNRKKYTHLYALEKYFR